MRTSTRCSFRSCEELKALKNNHDRQVADYWKVNVGLMSKVNKMFRRIAQASGREFPGHELCQEILEVQAIWRKNIGSRSVLWNL